MGEKVYKPRVKDGDHLVRSKDDPSCVRGLTRDENNQNPDIIEWEEYDLDDLRPCNYDYNDYSREEHEVHLTPEQEQLAEEIGTALGNAIVAGSIALFENIVAPWWKNTATPWLKERGQYVKDKFSKRKNRTSGTTKQPCKAKATNAEIKVEQATDVSTQVDAVFDQFYFEMTEEEARTHMMRLVYHMLGMVNEIRIFSNARIRKECESDNLCIEKQRASEKFLSERVAIGLDRLLSDETMRLDLDTSRKLFELTGGGVRLNGEYVPVQAEKIKYALKSMPHEDSLQ